MKKLVRLLATSAALGWIPGGAFAAVTANGLLDASYPGWNRISDAPGYPDSANDNLPYEVLEIATTVEGETLTAAVAGGTQFDSFLALYSAFDPAVPQANLVVADDDSGGYPHARLVAASLSSHTSYFLVISSYSNAPNSVYPLYGSYSLNLGGNFYVVPKLTTTVLAASPDPSVFGHSVTLTATVSRISGTASPTGTVTFKEGAAELGTASLNSVGQASLSVSSLALGTHSLSAVYSGETKYSTSASAPLSVTVAGTPIVTTGVASGISPTGATLNGTVADNGALTAVTFDYGASAAYGSTVAATTGGSIAPGSGSTAVAVAISGLTCNTVYHFRVNGSNLAGTGNGGDGLFTTSVCPQLLSVTLTGTGSGSVNSDPAGIACVSGSPSGCSSSFPGGSSVTLTASESLGSNFTEWTSCDSTLNKSCTVAMSADRNPAATFTLQQNLKIADSYFGTLQSALQGVSAGQTIQAQNMLLPDTGTVAYNRAGARATLRGGYDSSFTTPSGYSFLDGVLKVMSGTLVVDRFKVR